MNKKILIIGAFAEPDSSTGNSLLAIQASELQKIGYENTILTRPRKISWKGPVPDDLGSFLYEVPALHVHRQGLHYLVTLPSLAWCDRTASLSDWQSVVAWAEKVLGALQPDIVHMHSWQDLWYFMEASINLGLKTIFTAYDYGVPCLRLQLLTGDGRICDGKITLEKCVRCNLLHLSFRQKCLEASRLLPFGPFLLKKLYGVKAEGILCRKFGLGACYSFPERIQRLYDRFQKLFPQLTDLIVTSPFAKDIFCQSGISPDRIHIMPWPYA